MDSRKEILNSLKIGFICVFTYLVSYLTRNILSVLTPGMLESGLFTKSVIATFSSVYMVVYASGQLVNGFIGDAVKSKYMVLFGLLISGIALVLFPLGGSVLLKTVIFAFVGFGLSMLRGPLVKTISENTPSSHARICCVFLSFTSFAGPLLAGILAMFFDWSRVFVVSGIISVSVGVLYFVFLTLMEKSGKIKYNLSIKKDKGKSSFFDVFKLDSFMRYLFLGMIVEISSTSISFWIPTYITEYLNFSPESSSMIFSVISFMRSFCPFIALFLFKLFKERDLTMMRSVFLCSVGFYAIMFFVKNPWVNLVVFLLALVCTGLASSCIWSIYIPSLGKTGKSSSANGVLDCSGYVAAAIMNMVFAFAIDSMGWNGIIALWGIIMLIGAVLTIKIKQKNIA